VRKAVILFIRQRIARYKEKFALQTTKNYRSK